MSKFSVFYTLVVLLLFNAFPSIGKESTLVVNQHRTVDIGYVFTGISRNFNTNEILKELAKDAVKSLRSIRLKLDFDLKAVLEPDVNRSSRMNLSFFNPSFQGDHYFRGFDVSDVLLPGRADLEFLLSDTTGCYSDHGFSKEHYPVNWNDSTKTAIDFASMDWKKDSIHLATVFLYYDEDGLNLFHERIKLIHEYYASSAILDSLLILAYSMDMHKEDRYPVYFLFLEEINKAVEIIGRKRFKEPLRLAVYDPRNFNRKYDELFKLSKSLTMTFMEQIEKVESIHTTESADSVISVFFSGLMRYINWTLLVNDRNGNVYHEFLESYYSLNAFGDDLLILKKLLGKISPGENEDSLLAQVFHRVSIGYQERYASLLNENQFAEAIELFESARRFSAFNPFPEKEAMNDTARFMAANGIFSSYIGVAEGSIRNKKFEMAETYLAKALAYRKANFSSLFPDSLYKKVFLTLVDKMIAECDSMSSRKEFQESLDCFRYFEASHDSSSIAMIIPELKKKKEDVYAGLVSELLQNAMKYDESGAPDSALFQFDLANRYVEKTASGSGLKIRIDSMTKDFDKIRYRQLLTKAGNQIQRRDFPLAYMDLGNAKLLQEKHHFLPDHLFDTLWREVYPRFLQHFLMVSEKKIWMNQLRDAEKFADSIDRLQVSSLFAADSLLSVAIRKYRSRIQEKACLNAKEAVEIYGLRARHYLEQKKFLLAENLLDSAKRASENAANCHIPTGPLNDTIQKYQDAISFQRSMMEIENRLSVNQYTEALVKYEETESFFSRYKIKQFGITCEPIYNYVKEKSILRLTLAVVELYKNRLEYEKTLGYLKLYRLQDGKADDVKDAQRSIAKELAITDFFKTPEKDPAILLENYSGHDKWMSNFERAYIFQWNVLRNSASSHPATNE